MEHQHPYGQHLKSTDLTSNQDSLQQILRLLASEMNAIKTMKSIQLELPNGNETTFLTDAVNKREKFLIEILEFQAQLYPKV